MFAQNEDQQWAFRPPPEVVVKQLSKFFPKVNLDTEVIEAVATNMSIAAGPAPAMPASPNTKLQNRKSIRRVAEERLKILEKTAPAVLEPEPSVKVVRRRSTKMWGSKVEEVKPGQLKVPAHIPSAVLEIPEDGASPSAQPDTFKWVKGDLIGKGAVSPSILLITFVQHVLTSPLISFDSTDESTSVSTRRQVR